MITRIYNGSSELVESTTYSPLNRGFMYGDGCFDTLRTYQGKLLFPEKHYHRLAEALQYLRLETPFDESTFITHLRNSIPDGDDQSGDWVIRTQCWRKGERGYATEQTGCDWLMSISPLKSNSNTSLTLTVTEIRAIPEAALSRRFKLSNGLNYILAAQSAIKANTDDVVMLTMDGSVSETTIANLFWIRDNIIYTPSTNCDCYPGITREIVIDIAKKNGFTVEEGKFRLDHLYKAESVFVTNSVVGIRTVKSLSPSKYHTQHPLLVELNKRFENHLNENLS